MHGLCDPDHEKFFRYVLETYLADEGPRLLSSVGAYRLEGLGSQLFSDITGAHATILGLPLFPLLEELRNRGILQT